MKQEQYANRILHHQGCDMTKAWFDGRICSSPSDIQRCEICLMSLLLWHLGNSFRKAWYSYPYCLRDQMKQEQYANRILHHQGCDMTKAWIEGRICSSLSDIQRCEICLMSLLLWHLSNDVERSAILGQCHVIRILTSSIATSHCRMYFGLASTISWNVMWDSTIPLPHWIQQFIPIRPC